MIIIINVVMVADWLGRARRHHEMLAVWRATGDNAREGVFMAAIRITICYVMLSVNSNEQRRRANAKRMIMVFTLRGTPPSPRRLPRLPARP